MTKPILKTQKSAAPTSALSKLERDYCVQETLEYLTKLGCTITYTYFGMGNWQVRGTFPESLMASFSDEERDQIKLEIDRLPPKRANWDGSDAALLAAHEFGNIVPAGVSSMYTFKAAGQEVTLRKWVDYDPVKKGFVVHQDQKVFKGSSGIADIMDED